MTAFTPTTTLEQAAGNGDGTYNGARLAVFLIYCTTGKQLSESEGEQIVADAKARVRK